MTWASFDDGFCARPVWDAVAYPARWHYLALVTEVCRSRRWDGVLPRGLALRCSDVPDPAAALDELESAGLVTLTDAEVVLPFVDDHIPPEKQRPEHFLPRKRANQRAYRQRRCDAGKHSKDCPLTCPARVTDRVTGNAGAGRGGAGRETPQLQDQQHDDEERDPWTEEAPGA